MDTIIEHAVKSNYESLVNTLHKNKEDGISTYIHTSCRNLLRNRAKSHLQVANNLVVKQYLFGQINSHLTSKNSIFIVEMVVFWMNAILIERVLKKFEQNHQAYTIAIALSQNRDDQLAKTVEARLLSLNDIVPAEARYHVACRTNFENPMPKYSTTGRPTSTEKMALYNAACKKLEDDMELYTVVEFHSIMKVLGDDVY